MVREEELSLETIVRFVAASEEVRFEAEDRRQLFGWVEQVPMRQQYAQLGKARGMVRRYIRKMRGLNWLQVTPLIARYTTSRRVSGLKIENWAERESKMYSCFTHLYA